MARSFGFSVVLSSTRLSWVTFVGLGEIFLSSVGRRDSIPLRIISRELSFFIFRGLFVTLYNGTER